MNNFGSRFFRELSRLPWPLRPLSRHDGILRSIGSLDTSNEILFVFFALSVDLLDLALTGELSLSASGHRDPRVRL